MAVVHAGTHEHADTGSGVGFLLAVVLLAVLMFMFLYFGLPALRGTTTAPQFSVPGQVDVNLNR